MAHSSSRVVFDLQKFKIILDKNDKDVSQQILETGWYKDEEFEIKIFKKQLKKGMTVLDLGANIGFYTLLARSMVGKKGKVIALEPFPINANLLKKSIRINKFENVILLEAAASNKTGKSTMYLSPDYNSEHSLLKLDFNYPTVWRKQKQIPIMTVTVDSYFGKKIHDFHVDVIKMDIEGFETNALSGMHDTITSNKNLVLLTEFWPNGMIKNRSSPKEFLETLKQFNFKIHHIDDVKKKVYPVTIPQMLQLIEEGGKNPKDETMREWGWYSNILCIKTTKS
ncbi:MAG: FkbM family methyltransferase [Nitrososphaerota archaeon]